MSFILAAFLAASGGGGGGHFGSGCPPAPEPSLGLADQIGTELLFVGLLQSFEGCIVLFIAEATGHTQRGKAFLKFSPHLSHKNLKFEIKFLEIFPDVFYFVTSNPRNFTSQPEQPKENPYSMKQSEAINNFNHD